MTEERKGPPAPTPAGMARLQADVERRLQAEIEAGEAVAPSRTGSPGTGSFSTIGGAIGSLVGPAEPAGAPAGETERAELVLGERPADTPCPDCGRVVAPELVTAHAGPTVTYRAWQFPVHTCPEAADRKRAEAAERAEKARLWLVDPPQARRAEVIRRCLLPARTLPSLDRVSAAPGWAEAHQALTVHRDRWLAGERPERGLWLSGPTKLRKTLMLAACAFEVAHKTRRRVLFWNFERLMDEKARMAREQASRWDPQAAAQAELFVLDDIGTTGWTEPAVRTLYSLAEQATSAWGELDRTQTLYLSSNESPEELMVLLDRVRGWEGGERVVRRLYDLCELVEVYRVPADGAEEDAG